ncbi:serine/threonine-protein phosphatase 6 regulatory ankyrin repeat subunit B-like [Liolophura sinensis]|uniref:serine/threonine-protein phosphatase 6 regulatory ankyrin repeat subunit B-like n=1 Tax=Liolophura sinensis TaxID=3198878 RepID=UPI0031582299
MNMVSVRGRKNYEVLQKEIERDKLLAEASQNGNCSLLKQLLAEGASPDAAEFNRSLFYASKNYITPLQFAASAGHTECVDMLIKHGADINARDRFDVTAVHMAAEHGRLKCLQMLLDSGAEVHVPTKYSKHGSYTAVPHVGGTTPLHLAALHNHTKCVMELIWNGADYNTVDELGRTSLYIAAQNGYEETIHAHLNNAIGRDILSIPVKDTRETPLHECVKHNLLSCIVSLLQHGSDVNYRNAAGHSPLHLAVRQSDKFSMDVLRELLTKGYNTNVNLPDSNGMTPLHYVSFNEKRRPIAAVFLIMYGARVTITNKQGFSLLEQELKSITPDKDIIGAIAKSMVHLPSLESLRIVTSHHSIDPSQSDILSSKFEWYRSLTKDPRTLQHYCRCVIRQAMGAQRLRQVSALPLPTPLKDYLLLRYDQIK